MPSLPSGILRHIRLARTLSPQSVLIPSFIYASYTVRGSYAESASMSLGAFAVEFRGFGETGNVVVMCVTFEWLVGFTSICGWMCGCRRIVSAPYFYVKINKCFFFWNNYINMSYTNKTHVVLYCMMFMCRWFNHTDLVMDKIELLMHGYFIYSFICLFFSLYLCNAIA